MPRVDLAAIDYAILGVYFAFVLGTGWALRRSMRSSTDFFLAGRSIPAWVAGLALLSANLGAQEVLGMAASGAKYGIAASHFYWIGAIPAMVFLGVFMMPIYYGSRARSVPEYLRLRFDEKTRGFHAVSFAAMTVISAGLSMYAMGLLLGVLLGWSFAFSVIVTAVAVLLYILFGGLTSAIYAGVLQFFLLVAGLVPLVFLALEDVGGWAGLTERLAATATSRGFAPGAYTESGSHLGRSADNLMGVEGLGLAMGLGFVLSFGYWTTDFRVVQHAMAADSMAAARRAPLIAAFPKALFPILVVLPGMVALALTTGGGESGFTLPAKPDGTYNYDLTIPLMLAYYFPPGMLGLGLTALMASFMGGMASNVTAFNTVWTVDIYQAYIRREASDAHYLWVGRAATLFGVALSVAAAFLATAFDNIMDLLQMVFAFVNAPLLATFLLGMFWRRTTGHGAFTGLVAGSLAAGLHHGLSLPAGALVGIKGGWLGPLLSTYPSEMAQNFWTAIWAWTACLVVTVLVSLVTRPRPDEELRGLVYALTERCRDEGLAWYHRPAVLAVLVLGMTLVLNILFW